MNVIQVLHMIIFQEHVILILIIIVKNMIKINVYNVRIHLKLFIDINIKKNILKLHV